MKKYLVTGGSGFIGSAVVKKLLKYNNDVRVIDNQSRGSFERLKEVRNDIEIISGDIRDYKKVKKACSGIDVIIHLAYINGTKYFYEKPGDVLSVGVKGMINVLDAAKENDVNELLLASSSEVYQDPPVIPTPEKVPYHIPDPLNPRYSYAGGKIISELLSLYVGKDIFKKTVIFRPHNVYGPDMGGEHVIPEILNQVIRKMQKSKNINVNIQGSGSETRAFIYIDDFVEGLVVLDKKGKDREIYNIGTDEEISILKLIDEIENVTNCKITVKHSSIQKGSVMRRCPDLTKIKQLGFSPKIGIAEGLRRTLLWYNDYRNG